MENGFYIMLNMRVASGFENFGQFFLGDEERFARKLFSCLKGSPRISALDAVHMDLAEWKNDLPLELTIVNCSLEEIADNCRLITKELFRRNNLDADNG